MTNVQPFWDVRYGKKYDEHVFLHGITDLLKQLPTESLGNHTVDTFITKLKQVLVNAHDFVNHKPYTNKALQGLMQRQVNDLVVYMNAAERNHTLTNQTYAFMLQCIQLLIRVSPYHAQQKIKAPSFTFCTLV